MAGSCSNNCEDAQYSWQVQCNGVDIELGRLDTSTGLDKPNLSIRENVLQDEHEYLFM